MKIDESLDNLIVKTIPETLDGRSQRAFLRSLTLEMSEYRPRVVLDCSGHDAMNRSTIFLMLCCLEEALKRNGDVRLAGVSQAARATLEGCKADRLVQIYGSKDEAIESFYRPRAEFRFAGGPGGEQDRTPEKAT
jgi:anti-sigma B factor antagonist